jgi:hypothetical protein
LYEVLWIIGPGKKACRILYVVSGLKRHFGNFMNTIGWIKGLGYAGLIPFALLAFLSGYTLEPLALQVLVVYSFGILIFLTGSWWGIGLLRQQAFVLVMSNLLFLVVTGLFLWLSATVWLLVSACLFLGLYVMEGRLSAFARQPAYYRKLRFHLTVGVATSQLGLALWLLVGGY